VSSAGFYYRAFGLTIASALEIPQLPRIDVVPDEQIDVRLVLGNVDGTPVTRPGLRSGTLRSLFRYRSVNGRHVTLDCLAGADPRDIADMIVSRVMAIVIYQRGSLPLHASAVIVGAGIVAFAGASGCGKSTLAAALAARGHTVASDDMLIVRAVNGLPPGAWPGASRLKLSREVIDRLGQSPHGLPLANTQEEKFLVGRTRAADTAGQDGLPLRALFRVGQGAMAISPLRPVDAMACWPTFVRSTDLFPVAERREAIWQHWLDIIGAVPVLTLERPADLAQLPHVAALVDDFLTRIEIQSGGRCDGPANRRFDGR
jgi:hypothetical protein